MNQEFGKTIAVEMKKRGTGPKLWAVANGFHPRTVNQVLHHGLGSRRGGDTTGRIFSKLIEQGYIDENHQLIEPERKAS